MTPCAPSDRQNLGVCNKCGKTVPLEYLERDGRLYLVKHCPDCGTTESLSSSNAANCVSSGFRYCSRVSSCAADGGGAMEDGFNSCSYLSACVAENVTDKKYDNCVYACSESCH